MDRLIAYLLGRPSLIALTALAVSLLGVYGVGHMSLDLFPNLDVPVVQVIAHAPGSSVKDIEATVTRPVEEALRGAPGIRRVASVTREGVTVITVQFAWGIPVGAARQIVLGRVGQVRAALPAGVVPRLEHIGTTLEEVGGWAISGGGDPVELGAMVRRDLVARLMTVEGVSLVDVVGGERRAFWVELAPERLAALGLRLADIEEAIRQTHGAAVAGFVERANEDVVVRADSRLLTTTALAAVPLALPDGERIVLSHLARVHEGRAPRHSAVQVDGVPALAVFVRKHAGASTLAVARAVERELESARSALPPGTRIVKIYDQSEVLLEARRAVLTDLAAGSLLATIVLWLFLGRTRAAGAVLLTIPLALLATLAVLWLSGHSLNVITMAALTLAVGMIVDDAIVVTESVSRHLEAGTRPREAALRGTAEIAMADAAGTFTTAAAFLPLVMVGGLAALFLRPFGLTVAVALLASLLLSLTTVPAMLGRASGTSGSEPALAEPALRWLQDRVSRSVEWTQRRRRPTLLAAAALTLAAAVSLALHHGPISLLPPIDEGALLVEYILPPGVSLTESVRVGGELGRLATRLPGVVTVEARVGAPEGGASVEGINRGELRIKLAPLASGRPSAEELLHRLDRAAEDLAGVVLLLHQPTQERMAEAFSGLPSLFAVTVFGPDVNELETLSAEVEDTLRRDPAVHDIVNNSRFRRPRMEISIDGTRCAALGVDPAEVRRAVSAATWGKEVLRVLREREEVPILLRLEGFHSGLETLATLPVATRKGGVVPLGRVASLSLERVPAQVDRLNGQRQVTLVAETDGNLVAVARRVRRRLATLDLPVGYSVALTGQFPLLIRTGAELLFVLAAAAALILGIMAVAFGSLRESAWILALTPVSLGGGALGIALTGSGVNMASAIGALTVLGLSVNNGIVLVDFANRKRAQGVAAAAAFGEAVTVRLRPILATTLTTVAGLVPTALAFGSGQHVFQPFAITVIFGLVASTLATLVLLPTALLADS